MAAYLICLIVGYFCGCISTGYFVGKFYHMDIRTKGSGNAGTTNVLRKSRQASGSDHLCRRSGKGNRTNPCDPSGVRTGAMVPLVSVLWARCGSGA